MIREFEFYHGAALARLIHSSYPVSIKLYPTPSNASYIINNKVGLYLKHSSQRMTPWRFSFSRGHQEEISEIKEKIGKVVIGLICYDDGVVGLNYEEFNDLLTNINRGTEWICVSRKAKHKYSVKGSDGKLHYKIGEGEFAQKVLELP